MLSDSVLDPLFWWQWRRRIDESAWAANVSEFGDDPLFTFSGSSYLSVELVVWFAGISHDYCWKNLCFQLGFVVWFSTWWLILYGWFLVNTITLNSPGKYWISMLCFSLSSTDICSYVFNRCLYNMDMLVIVSMRTSTRKTETYRPSLICLLMFWVT